MENCSICFESVSLELGDFRAKPNNMKIPKGYLIQIEGENGAGKSTLLKMIHGRYKKTKGKIWIDGVEVLEQREKALQKVAFISEENTFFEEYTLEENEMLYQGYVCCWDKERYREEINRFGLLMQSKVGGLSKGNRMKYQLAFALAQKPSIILMDEPMAGLDPVVRMEFMKRMHELICENNMTIIMATHLGEEIDHITDYTIRAEAGVYYFKMGRTVPEITGK